MTELEEYYNKFNEEKRLNSRHGRVEFITSMKYIHDCLGSLMNEKQLDDEYFPSDAEGVEADNRVLNLASDEKMLRHIKAIRSQIKILDVGAGTGRYSVPLAEEGYDVPALELV